jgi:hypothetical protein
MDVEVVEALDDDRTVVRRLLQRYHYDFSEFDGSDVNPHGEYLHRYLDEYWTDSSRKAFLFRVDGALAGARRFATRITSMSRARKSCNRSPRVSSGRAGFVSSPAGGEEHTA